jgi:uncharacterized DUF497 family protein
MFTWDRKKAILNFAKHGISFAEAATVFDDVRGLEWKDSEHSLVETRLKRLASSQADRILIVVYTIRRTKHGKEAIRIISARQASRKERKAYAGLCP